jgi:hypothetical protein
MPHPLEDWSIAAPLLWRRLFGYETGDGIEPPFGNPTCCYPPVDSTEEDLNHRPPLLTRGALSRLSYPYMYSYGRRVGVTPPLAFCVE